MFRCTRFSAKALFAYLWHFATSATALHHVGQQCMSGNTIPNSNRTGEAPCIGTEGTECHYSCKKHHLKIGRHVCQSYGVQGNAVLDNAFFGGSCTRLCATDFHSKTGLWCPPAGRPVRWHSHDKHGYCLATSCWKPTAALEALALGNYEVWSLARNNNTGIYLGRVDLRKPKDAQNWKYSHLGVTGLGVIFECAAHSLGWTRLKVANKRVLQTMRALAGELPGVKVDRNAHGWMPTHFDTNTGTKLSNSSNFTAFDTGLNTAAMLFAATYFLRVDPDSNATQHIHRLAAKLLGMVDFAHLLCNKQHVLDMNGTGIGGSFGSNDECVSQIPLSPDGKYAFSEIVYTAWLAYKQACHGFQNGTCAMTGIENMWHAFQARRFAVKDTFEGQPIVSKFPSYIMQLPFYTVHAVNADKQWKALFDSYWLADWAFYNSSAFYAGDTGRYGLAAGFADSNCTASGTSYEVMHFNLGPDHGCRIYSPSAVAGYAPIAPSRVKHHLFQLLEHGDGVRKLNNSEYFVLLRKSLLNPDWSSEQDITMIDFSSEFLGLTSLLLGADFYVKNTKHDFDSLFELGGVYSSDEV